MHKFTYKLLILASLMFTIVSRSDSQDLTAPLYKNGEIPFAIPHTIKDSVEYEKDIIRKKHTIVEPSIEFYGLKKDGKIRPAFIFCPGGGYSILSYTYEGKIFAEWLATKDMVGIILNSRLPDDRLMINKSEVPLTDALNAIKYVRDHAVELGIDPNKIGIMGFSAGGHLAASASVMYTSNENKPNAVALIYPVISMQDSVTHNWSQTRLLGANATQAMKDRFSTHMHINAQSSPTFLIHSADDKSVKYQNSLLYFEGLQKHQIPNCEMHIMPNGGHGYDMALDKAGNLPQWRNWFYGWVRELGW